MHRFDFAAMLLSPATWFVFAFGSLFGSFFNVCIYRIPRGIFWKKSRSHCPACDAPIPSWHNIPILSWLFLRGKAACCGSKISVQYPLVELGTALLWVVIYWSYPFLMQLDGSLVYDNNELLRFAHALVFCSVLLICSVIDLEHQIIPDVLSLPMIALAPLVAWFHPELNLKSSLIGVAMGGGIFYAIAWIYFLVRKQYGLGLGDVKLLAAIGGWLGYQSVITTMLWASVFGSLVGISAILITRKKDLQLKIPFGPFLSGASVTYLLFGRYFGDYLFPF
ncbi:MAG: prepilin peptidase [Chitinophagaceae bacterium]|nr:prepilin peptidase [Oligoflexus sp.]